MHGHSANLITRDDTLFGVCEAIGEDFGFHANWLRIGFAVLLFVSPVGAIGGYAAAGVLVLASRLLIPNPRLAPADEVSEESEASAHEEAAPAQEAEVMAEAA